MSAHRVVEATDSPSPGSLEALREQNRRLIVESLRRSGIVSRADIARLTGLSRSTVSSVVADLLSGGLVREMEPAAGAAAQSGGRPAIPLVLEPSAGVALGISLSRKRLRVGLSDFGHAILAERSAPISGLADEDAAIELVASEVEAALTAAGVSPRSIAGAAMTIPAPIERRAGRIAEQSIGPLSATFEANLEERLGIAVHVENDANVSVLAEMIWGVAAGHRDVAYLKLSSGIGAGLVLNGHLFRGAQGTAGEIGHTPVVADGRLCRCGNRGCLETVAGTDAIVDLLEEPLGERLAIDTVIRRALGGDPACRRAIRDAAIRIGTAVASICNLLNPELVVIGGELAQAWPVMDEPLRHALDGAAIHSAADGVRIVPSALGSRADLLGALALVLRDAERFVTSPVGERA
ncbi:MAG: ROK family transcriptional regulator [Actinobacteria bacterium]|nr:ROK family transcriptional regulator [Actinomycetota bacterium]